ncbi:TPA: RNA-directed DNA polymerase [Bacillus wiedmannii]|nr:RNA-directed DNA polymerase [Bacillus wiedmannii]
MIGYIYNEDFFYKKILSSEKRSVRNTLLIKESMYTERQINKKDGIRILSCIAKDSSIYNLQNNLRMNFLNNIPIPNNVKGFLPGHSYKDFVIPHLKQKYYLRLDIKNFFDSVTSETIKEVFSEYFKLDSYSANNELLEVFTEIVTLRNSLPQGGVTSPTISNIAFRRIDIRISKYCKRFNINYTRYADDLLFSSNQDSIHKSFFIKKISYILNDLRLKINSSKIKKTKDYISLNGFVVRDDISLSRKRKSDLSKVLFLVEKNKKISSIENILSILNHERYLYKSYDFDNKWALINYLSGYRALIIDWLPLKKQAINYKKNQQLIKRIENTIDFLLEEN